VSTGCEGPGDQGFVFPALGAAVVDGRGTVTAWSPAAERLTGVAGDAACGRPFAELFPGTGGGPAPSGRTVPAGGRTLDVHALPLTGAGGHSVVLFADERQARTWGYGVSLLEAFLRQHRMGLVLHGGNLDVALTNFTPGMFGGPGFGPGDRLSDVAVADEAHDVEKVLGQVLLSGEPEISREERLSSAQRPGKQWLLSWSALRLEDAEGRPTGVAAVVNDVSDQERVRRHRDLLHRAATAIGFSLDMRRTAQHLADVTVEGLADLATVDIAQPVLAGDEPATAPLGNVPLIRLAVASADGTWPQDVLGPGGSYKDLPESAEVLRIQQGHAFALRRQDTVDALGSEELVRLLVPPGAHSLVVVPLFARGRLLGSVTGWRTRQPEPYDDSEVELLTEIGSRAALGIDNARRYAREHRAAAALQQRLLPRAGTDTPAARTAGVYQAAGGTAGISGDWFDAISLPSLRAAFVVGDVIGHGLPAAAAMGRLRTAIQTYADLEMEPSEVLARVEDLVQRLAAEAPQDQQDTIGATCLYAVYDPTTHECTLASAGHPPPVLVEPGGARVVDVVPGPPLGVGGAPFQSVTFPVAPGSVLALYTDGLFELRGYDGPDGIGRLRDDLAAACSAGAPLEQIGRTIVERPHARPPRDDIALLLARTRAVDPRNVRAWRFPARGESVAEARAAAVRQLQEWGQDGPAFSAELVVSELVTNAIRHGSGPVTLRLILDRTLICEVADASNTQPRLLRAADTDEGGRGLFIVAQCTTRWGCRYGRQGKTIWTEQPLEPAG